MHKNKYWKYTQVFAVTKSSKSIKYCRPPRYWRLYKILASHENIGGCLKYWRMPEILASHENSGGCLKYWRMPEILASHENSGGCLKSWRVSRMLAGVQNIDGCPKYWQVSKILAPAENQAALLFRLGGISCCWLPPGLAEELSFRSS